MRPLYALLPLLLGLAFWASAFTGAAPAGLEASFGSAFADGAG